MEPKEYLEQRALERLDSNDPTIKDVADVVKLIYGRMWSKDDLTAYIVQTHNALCAQCTKTQISKIAGIDVKWFCGLITTLVSAVTAALTYFINH